MSTRVLLVLAAAASLAACGSSSDTMAPTTGQITLTGTSTFNGPHAGQTMRGALVRASDGVVLDIQRTTVAAAGTSPAFSMTFSPTVDLATAHKVRYWVDFNSDDACDAPPTDHQWEADVPAGQGTITVAHTTTFTPVCDTFTFPLTFLGSATFNGPHAGNAYRGALVRGGATTALEILSGTVAAAGTSPAFTLAFTPRLVIGEQYAVKLWMDFDGSTTCDAPPTDHQWSVPIAADLSGHQQVVTYDHNTTFTGVCSFFP